MLWSMEFCCLEYFFFVSLSDFEKRIILDGRLHNSGRAGGVWEVDFFKSMIMYIAKGL